jgi:hypothetical protein
MKYDQMWKDVRKWVLIFSIWLVILILSLVFIENVEILRCISGIWIFITGLFMISKRKDYEKWYYDNYK